jgi:hypothetical protein
LGFLHGQSCASIPIKQVKSQQVSWCDQKRKALCDQKRNIVVRQGFLVASSTRSQRPCPCLSGG